MRHWLYQLLMILAFPLWLYYSYRRCRQSAEVGACWRELWGVKLPHLPKKSIWVHAVSLGEAQVAVHLMRELRQRYPALPIFFTAGNASALTVVRKAQDLSELPSFASSYLPLDYAWIRRRLFQALQPSLLVLIETELWPNLLLTAHQASVPVAMIQARVSRRSKTLYPRYMQPLLSQLLSPVRLLAAQTEEDRQFFVSMGANADSSVCLGNLKYDLPARVDQFSAFLPVLSQSLASRWVWCAGSTHQGEETVLLSAHRQLLQTLPQALLLLAPRHLRHLEAIYFQLQAADVVWITWSELLTCQRLAEEVEVVVIDQLGVLLAAYQLSSACFVGGSLVPWGGHNMLEPASLKKPIVTGQYNHNFAEIAQALTQAQALTVVDSATALAKKLHVWADHPEQAQAQGVSGFAVFLSQKGATERVITTLSQWITEQWQGKTPPTA